MFFEFHTETNPHPLLTALCQMKMCNYTTGELSISCPLQTNQIHMYFLVDFHEIDFYEASCCVDKEGNFVFGDKELFELMKMVPEFDEYGFNDGTFLECLSK